MASKGEKEKLNAASLEALNAIMLTLEAVRSDVGKLTNAVDTLNKRADSIEADLKETKLALAIANYKHKEKSDKLGLDAPRGVSYLKSIGLSIDDLPSRAQLSKCWDKYDLDGNKRMDKKEFFQFLQDVGSLFARPFSGDDMASMFDLCDKDKNGTLDKKEFLHLFSTK